MEPLAKRRRLDHESYSTQNDFQEWFNSTYPEFCNLSRMDEKPTVENVGITKFYFEIIFNLKIQVPNPLQSFLDKLQKAIDIVKAEEPNGIKLGIVLKSISENSKLEHDLHIPWAKYTDDVVQFFANRLEQLHESNEACQIFEEKLLLEITTFKPVLAGNGEGNPAINNKNLISPGNTDKLCLFICIYGLIEIIKIKVKAKQISERKKRDKANGIRSRETPYNETERIKNIANSMKHPSTKLYKDADQLRRHCNIQKSSKGYGTTRQFQKIQDYLNATYDHTYRLVVFDHNDRITPEFKGIAKNIKYDICILFYQNHFYAITNINNFVNNDTKRRLYYCIDCETTFTNPSRHQAKCVFKCHLCARWGYEYPCKNELIQIKCEKCNKNFFNKDCFEHHKTLACSLYHKCLKCNASYSRDNLKNKPHVCGEKYCSVCQTIHEDRPCFIQAIQDTPVPTYRLITFDFESRQDEIVGLGKKQHVVNYCVAHTACTKCLDNGDWLSENSSCNICGIGPRTKSWSGLEGNNCLAEFVDYLFTGDKDYETVALAHYGGRYDCIFILRDLFRRTMGNFVEAIKVGNKFYQITVKKNENRPKITFKDSFNYLPVPLSELVKTFSLDIEEKKYFPHEYNAVVNYEKQLPNLPDIRYYSPQTMTVKKRAEFTAWYDANKNTPFSLKEQLPIYCRNDVNILKHSVAKFREIWLKHFEVDAVYHCATIASACMRSYRKKHLQYDSLPIVPEGGYHKHSRASEAALRYFYWRRETTGEQIQFHDSPEGEKQIARFKVDGYIESTKKVIEYNGCAFHGCLKCFDPNTKLPTGKKAIDQYEETKEKENILKAMGYDVESVWECEVNEMIKNFDAETRKNYNKKLIAGPLNPRDAYFGGRTGPLCLHQKIKKSDLHKYQMSLADVRSLYPAMNYITEYPVGIPDLIDIPANEQDVRWTKPSDNIYKGLIKAFIIPPKKDCKLPVIPYKINGFLLFGLCRTCALDYSKKNTKDPDYQCCHSDEDRGFLITTTHMELNLALEKKYVVTKVYSAYHFKKFSSNLFAPYVRDCMKLKAENDDYPVDVITEEDQDNFIKIYKEKFNIILDKEKIKKNPGLRYTSKLAANSMWGRFSLRNNLAKTVIVSTGCKANKIMECDRYIISTVDIINEKEVMIVYTMKKEFVTENSASNIIVSLWTTSAARIALYRLMEMVEADPNCKLLYTDTDSILLLYLRGQLPFPLGNFLGDMALEHIDIKEYVSGGCKQYALKIIDPETGEYYYIMKIRGISITSEVAEDLHFKTFRDMVKNYGNNEQLELPVTRILPHRTGYVYTVNQTKVYKSIYQKGIICDDMDIIPFGLQ